MNQVVTGYIEKLSQTWQAELCRLLDQTVHQAVPEVTERLQYGKPHYLKNGKYVCVLSAPKGAVTLTIFNAVALTAPEGLFESGPPERKTVRITQQQAADYDYDLLARLLSQAANTP